MSNFLPVLKINGGAQGTLAPSTTVVATTAGSIPHGAYELWSTVGCWIKVGSTAVTTDNGYRMETTSRPIVEIGDGRVLSAVCTAGASGVLAYHRVG